MSSPFGPWATTFDTAGMSLARFWKSRIAGLPLARSAGQSPTRRAAVMLAVCAALMLAAPTLSLSRAPAQGPEPDGQPAAASSAQPDSRSEIKLEPLPAAMAPEPQVAGAKLVPVGLAEVAVEPLTVPGSLAIDPTATVRIRLPLDGEIVAIGQTEKSGGKQGEKPSLRNLRVGDRVAKGQLLAVVASKEVGEMKSDLVGALAQQRLDEQQLQRLKSLEAGTVPKSKILEAERAVELDKVAVEKAARRLRSSGIPEDEIERIIKHDAAQIQAENDIDVRYSKQAADVARFTYRKNLEAVAKVKNAVAQTELKKLELAAEKARLAFEAATKKAEKDARRDENWNRFEIHAPLAGVILERSAVVGDAIDADANLFIVADLTELIVRADVSEKLTARLEALPSDERNWLIFRQPDGPAGTGSIESIGQIVDPARQTIALTGSLDNRGGDFRAGQVVTVVVPQLPVEGPFRAIPLAALVQGDAARGEWKVWVKPKAADAAAEVQLVYRQAISGPWAICLPVTDGTIADPLPVGSKVVVWRKEEAASSQPRAKALVALTDENSIPLADAIKQFNQRAATDRIGREQPPLTEEEVVAAILWSALRKTEPVTEAEYAAFRQIAETRRMPKGSEFEFLTGFVPNDRVAFEAWSVRIRMPRLDGGMPGWTYAFAIRERSIASRPIGDEERKVMAEYERNGMPSMGRAEYIKKREEAQAIDKARREVTTKEHQSD